MKKVLHALTALFTALAVVVGLIALSAAPAQAYPFRYDDYYVSWDDDDNPGRTYDTSKSWTILANGMGWGCVAYTGDGATDEVVIYAFDEGPVRDIDIPETLSAPDGNTYRVVGIVTIGDIEGKDSLSGCHYGGGYYYPDYIFGNPSFVRTVTIPANVRFIGKGAFNRYTGLESVTFAEGSQLQVIEAGAFANCTSLLGTDGTTTLAIPSSVTTIGAGAFTNCQSLTNVQFPAGASISADVLSYGAFSLTSITNAPTRLSFAEETPLATVSFSPGLEIVGGIGGGDNLPNLSYIGLPDGATAIGEWAFEELPSLSSITLPSSIRSIGNGAFYNDTALSEIGGFPGSIEEIEDYAFYGCTNLVIDVVHPGRLDNQYTNSGVRSITFDAAAMENEYWWSGQINAEPFSGCKNLVAINVIGGSYDTMWSEDGVLYYHAETLTASDGTTRSLGKRLVKYPAAKSGGSYTVPSFVGSIEVYAFEDSNFSEIHIPVTVTDLMTFTNYAEDTVLSPFTGMASSPTIYYVEYSYASVQLEGWDSPIYDEWYDAVKPRYDMIDYDGPLATEAGPTVRIEYSMDGGVNNPNNPTNVVGGSSVQLLAPTRSDAAFTRWYRRYDAETFVAIEGNVLAPRLEELVNGVVTVEPGWDSDPFFLDADPADTNNHGLEVDWMGRSGISTGWEVAGGREYRGLKTVTRCDFAAFLYRFADLRDNGARDDSIALTDAEVEAVLRDVKDCTPKTDHAAEIAWLIKKGISRGWDNGDGTVSFRPYATVARQDMAAFLYRYADLADNEVQDGSPAMGPQQVRFSDVRHGDDANHAAEVEWLASVGVTKGWDMGGGTYEFRGTRTVARQDMAAFMYRLYTYLEG